jgi:hypothetical protein
MSRPTFSLTAVTGGDLCKSFYDEAVRLDLQGLE